MMHPEAEHTVLQTLLGVHDHETYRLEPPALWCWSLVYADQSLAVRVTIHRRLCDKCMHMNMCTVPPIRRLHVIRA